MPEIVCPQCQQINDVSDEFCANCSHRLAEMRETDETISDGHAIDEGREDIQEELASVREELAEATRLLDRLRLRLMELETRITRDSSAQQPEDIDGDVLSAEHAAILSRQPAFPEPSASTELAKEAELPKDEIPLPASGTQGSTGDQSSRGSRIDWEQVLGKNWFAIIGGVAVVLGIGFFLKLAFDNNWIGDTGRVALGVVVGMVFLGVGEYAQRRAPRWAQAVTASGAAILYLSIYAAFGLYQLIRPEVAFLLLAVVAAVAVLLALRYESIIIALLGVVGAFISPLLLGTDLPDKRLVLASMLESSPYLPSAIGGGSRWSDGWAPTVCSYIGS